jgi:hypothetical protein
MNRTSQPGGDRILSMAQRMAARYGYVVVAVAAISSTTFRVGGTTSLWAGWILPKPWRLRVICNALRADWDEQFRFLFPGKTDPTPVAEGAEYFKAALEQGEWK